MEQLGADNLAVFILASVAGLDFLRRASGWLVSRASYGVAFIVPAVFSVFCQGRCGDSTENTALAERTEPTEQRVGLAQQDKSGSHPYSA